MKKQANQIIRNLLQANPNFWNHGDMRAAVRENFARVCACKVGLGSKVFVSPNGESRLVPHTCKSRACPSCGYWQTMQWMRNVRTVFPDGPCSGIVFSMPDTFWEIFRGNRQLLPAVAELGAGVLQDWALERYGAEVPVFVAMHTFGARLNFNVHLHVVVGRVGLDRTGRRLVENIRFYPDEMTKRWRHTIVEFLLRAIDRGLVRSTTPHKELRDAVQAEHHNLWKRMVRDYNNQTGFLRYVGRYLRRPPMAEYRILPSPGGTVHFRYRDKKDRNNKVEECTNEEFILRYADQVPDRYRNGIRYFGLLSPRAKVQRYAAYLFLLGQRRPSRRPRLRWAASLIATFGYDPLRDSQGERMVWSHHLPPMLPGAT